MAFERNPKVAEAMAARDWDFVDHGSRWIDYHGVDEETEREHIRRSIEVISRLIGSRLLGWYFATPSSTTRRLVLEEGGFLYDSDAYNDELPYWNHDYGRPHLIIPHTLDDNDTHRKAPCWCVFQARETSPFDRLDLLTDYAESSHVASDLSEGSVAMPSALRDGRLERGGEAASDFKGRHFGGENVLWAVRWYCRYSISYRDLEQMMAERGASVDHSSIYRWVQRHAPEIEKRLRWHWARMVVRISIAVRNALQPPRLSPIQANGKAADQTVPHLHVHALPPRRGDRLPLNWSRARKSNASTIAKIANPIRQRLPAG